MESGRTDWLVGFPDLQWPTQSIQIEFWNPVARLSTRLARGETPKTRLLHITSFSCFGGSTSATMPIKDAGVSNDMVWIGVAQIIHPKSPLLYHIWRLHMGNFGSNICISFYALCIYNYIYIVIYIYVICHNYVTYTYISTQPFSGSAGAFFWAISTKDRLTPEEVRALWLGQAQKMGLFPGLSHRPEWEWDGIHIKSLFCIFFRGKWAVKDDIWRCYVGVPLHFQTTKSHDYYPADDLMDSMGASRLMGHPISMKASPIDSGCSPGDVRYVRWSVQWLSWVQCFGHARGSTIDVFGLLQSHGRPDLRTTCANTLHETWRIVKREK